MDQPAEDISSDTEELWTKPNVWWKSISTAASASHRYDLYVFGFILKSFVCPFVLIQACFPVSELFCDFPRSFFISKKLFPFHIVSCYLFSGTKENYSKQSHTRKTRLRASTTQRRIQDLSVNMRMKEELIKELNKTGVFMYIHTFCVCQHSPVCWLVVLLILIYWVTMDILGWFVCFSQGWSNLSCPVCWVNVEVQGQQQ